MAIDPVATYNAEILAKGYQMTGDVRSGLKATVPYLVTWDNAFLFINAVILPIYADHVGNVTFTHPYRFPQSGGTTMYAQRFTLEPCGYGGGPAPTKGLLPGEFFSHCIVKVEFESLPTVIDQQKDDPNNLHQLDPNNPITMCEQSVKTNGKMSTRKGLQYKYSDDNKPVFGDVGVFRAESKLVLKFPRVPYLPWQLIQPYVGKVNSVAILGCDVETLLLEGSNTDAKATLNAQDGQSMIEEAVQLMFAYDADGWNKAPKPDGTMVTIYRSGDSSKGIYEKTDFRSIFNNLSFSQSG